MGEFDLLAKQFWQVGVLGLRVDDVLLVFIMPYTILCLYLARATASPLKGIIAVPFLGGLVYACGTYLTDFLAVGTAPDSFLMLYVTFLPQCFLASWVGGASSGISRLVGQR